MGGIAAALVAALPQLLPVLLGGMWPDLVKLFGKYNDGQISEATLRAEVEKLAISKSAEIDVAHLDAMSRGFSAFMNAAPRSKWLQLGWVVVVFSQLFVLVWYQWVVPWGDLVGWWDVYPSPGGTIEWAYALLSALFLGSPLVFSRRIK